MEFSFEYFYQTVVEESKDLTMPPILPRQKHIPVRIDDGAPNHHFSTPEEHFTNSTMKYMTFLQMN